MEGWTKEYEAQANAVAEGLRARLQEPMRDWMAAHQLEGLQPLGLQMALAAEPTPLTEARVLRQIPYQAAPAATELLAALGRKGLLTPVDGGYLLTAQGHAALDEMMATVMTTLEGLPSFAGAEALAAFLSRLVEASERSPIDSYTLQGSRAFDPGDEAPVWARIRRYLGDLAAFRDDAHVAAWQPYDLAGYQWEAFSHIWGRKTWGRPVDTAAALAEKLGFRGYDLAAIQQGLDSLVERGWLEQEGQTYRLSGRGLQIREGAEVATDAFCYGIWDLSPAEGEQFLDLLRQAKVCLDQA